MCRWLWRSGVVTFPEPGVSGGYESFAVGVNSRLRSLEEQLALLTSELSLQPGIVSTFLRCQISCSKSPFTWVTLNTASSHSMGMPTLLFHDLMFTPNFMCWALVDKQCWGLWGLKSALMNVLIHHWNRRLYTCGCDLLWRELSLSNLLCLIVWHSVDYISNC